MINSSIYFRLNYAWDCPCYGCRFDTGGNVIKGTALTDLKENE